MFDARYNASAGRPRLGRYEDDRIIAENQQYMDGVRRRMDMGEQEREYLAQARLLAAQQAVENVRSGKIQRISPTGNAFQFYHGSAGGAGTEDKIRNLLSQ